MDSTLAGMMTIAALVVIQIGMFAYGYGKLRQKVDDLCKKVEDNTSRINNLETKTIRMEKVVNHGK